MGAGILAGICFGKFSINGGLARFGAVSRAVQCSKIACNRVVSSAGVAAAYFWRRTFSRDRFGVF
ncbi:MAG TPA: hypothetical protein VK797_21030, partial [Tepidisphaeraceae bacterium]|nr:hypothetical protein [Tepidisphaeraceae bacterium]